MNYTQSPQINHYQTARGIVNDLVDRDVNYTRYDEHMKARFGVG